MKKSIEREDKFNRMTKSEREAFIERFREAMADEFQDELTNTADEIGPAKLARMFDSAADLAWDFVS